MSNVDCCWPKQCYAFCCAALHHATPVSLPTDFHSFRRAFCTGIAGANVQTAVSLAGHSSAATHQRYVNLAEALTVPAAAIPTIALAPKGAATTG